MVNIFLINVCSRCQAMEASTLTLGETAALQGFLLENMAEAMLDGIMCDSGEDHMGQEFYSDMDGEAGNILNGVRYDPSSRPPMREDDCVSVLSTDSDSVMSGVEQGNAIFLDEFLHRSRIDWVSRLSQSLLQ